MPVAYDIPQAANHRYQLNLALALVAELGFDAALETCRQNGWEGTLNAILTGGCGVPRRPPRPRRHRVDFELGDSG